MANKKFSLIFKDVQKDGLWYGVHEDDSGRALWEIWAWEAQDDPADELHQDGYRFRHIGDYESGD